jgi:hypothetical protein
VDRDHEEATMVHARPLALHAITLAALTVLAACGVGADPAPAAPEAREAAFLRELVSEDESAPGDDDTVLEWVYVSCKGTRCFAAGIRRPRERLADNPVGDVLDRDDSEHQAEEADDAPTPTTR